MMNVGELENFYHLSRQNIRSREQKDALIEQRELLEERIAELQEVLLMLDCRIEEWGFAKDVYVDSADQATITELRKYKRLHGCLYNFWDAYKKLEILDRVKLQLGWIEQGCYLVVGDCVEHLSELDRYSWDEEKDKPEDKNDHTINAGQYGWIPYKHLIGFEEG